MKNNHKIENNGDWRNPISFTSWIPLHPPPSKKNNLKEGIEDSLKKYNNEIASTCDSTGLIHSFRIVVTPKIKQENYDHGLIINFVYDKSDDCIVEKLCPILVKALGNYVQARTAGGLRELILRHQIHHKTLFLGNIHLTIKDIKEEQRLFNFLQKELDDIVSDDKYSNDKSDDIQITLREQVIASQLELPNQAKEKYSSKIQKRRRRDLLRSLSNPLLVGLSEDINKTIGRIDGFKQNIAKLAFFFYKLIAYLFAAPFGIAVLLTEWLEKDVDTGSPSKAELDLIEESEDLQPKNSVTLVFPVKHSWIRRVIMSAILSQAEKGSRHFWTEGKLVDIDTLHYARIFLTPSKRTMIFMSDYDGGLDRYLDDFLGVGQRAVVAISSSVHGCPPTKLFKPANISVFRKRWRMMIRRHQYLDAFWYSGYPDLEVDQIINHHQIRQGLFSDTMSPEEKISWLRKL